MLRLAEIRTRPILTKIIRLYHKFPSVLYYYELVKPNDMLVLFSFSLSCFRIISLNYHKPFYTHLNRNTGLYRGNIVAVKCIQKRSVDLTRTIRKELKQMREVLFVWLFLNVVMLCYLYFNVVSKPKGKTIYNLPLSLETPTTRCITKTSFLSLAHQLITVRWLC